MIDFHTHTLPRFDDGAKTLEESIKMLEDAYERGTKTLVCSSHFYPRTPDSIDKYLDRRNRRIAELKEATKDKKIPRILTGAEVNLRTDISKFERLYELCIEGTDYIMLEMPMTGKWEDWMYECIYSIKLMGMKPLMAHIDRFMGHSKAELAAIDENKPAYQVNAEAFESYSGRKIAYELFKTGRIHVLGSDMHGIKKRKNRLPEAFADLEKRFGKEYIDFINENSKRILNNELVLNKGIFPEVKKSKLLF